MYKSSADEIITNMKEELEKRADVWDWFKRAFLSSGDDSVKTKYNRSQRLTYEQFLAQINVAQNCEELPVLQQWGRDVPPEVNQKYGYDTELIGNMMMRKVEEKRKQLQQTGKCK